MGRSADAVEPSAKDVLDRLHQIILWLRARGRMQDARKLEDAIVWVQQDLGLRGEERRRDDG